MELYRRYDDIEDAPPPPDRPDWCGGMLFYYVYLNKIIFFNLFIEGGHEPVTMSNGIDPRPSSS